VTGPFGFEVRAAWRRNDAAIEADAIDFWRRNALLPDGVEPEARAKELIAAAYKDGKLVAVSTATIMRIEFLRANFAVIRGATDPRYRRSKAQLALAVPSREALQSWAIAHPEEKLAGGFVFVDQSEWGDFTKLPVWPESELALVGYGDDGQQLRAAWFDHFVFGRDPVLTPPPLPPVSPEGLAGVEFREGWRREDPQIEVDVIAFWNRLGILPAGASAEERVKDIVIAAYLDGQVIGVVTASLDILPQVRARLAMLRGAVDPAFRRRHIGIMMMFMVRPIIERWSRDNPRERVAGIGTIVQSPDLAERAKRPWSRFNRYMLIGFTPNDWQVRVNWFEDFRLD